MVTVLLVGIATFLVALFTLIYIAGKSRREEIAVLRSLYQHLNYLKIVGQAQRRYMDEYQKSPSWTLIPLDLNFYLPRINYKIKKEGVFSFKRIYTRDLKDITIEVADSVVKINNLFNLMYTADALLHEEKSISYGVELLEGEYHRDLARAVDESLPELRKILKPIS